MRKSIISGLVALLVGLSGFLLTACQSSGTSSGVSAANPSTQPSPQVAGGYRSNIGNGAYGESPP
jgi:hypothetical protein